MRLRHAPVYALFLLLAACNLSSDSVVITPQPEATATLPESTPVSSGECYAVNTIGEEIEIYAPDDIGTVIGLLAPGEQIAIKDILPNEAAPWRMGWLVVSVPEIGEDGYLDPNMAGTVGDCSALWTPPPTP